MKPIEAINRVHEYAEQTRKFALQGSGPECDPDEMSYRFQGRDIMALSEGIKALQEALRVSLTPKADIEKEFAERAMNILEGEAK